MSGRHSFSSLRAGLSEARRAGIENTKSKLRADMSLAELREARNLTQQTIGAILEVGQPSVAKLEKRTDMYVGTLRRYVQAAGGELEIVARFPEGEVRIINFSDLESA